MPNENSKKHQLTKKRFERILRKAAQPLPAKESAPKETETAASRPSGGYSGRCRNQDKTEDTEG